MIDRAASADFLAGGMFGGGLLVASLVLAIVIIIPVGSTNWSAFVRGAIIVPGIVTAIIASVMVIAWLMMDKP